MFPEVGHASVTLLKQCGYTVEFLQASFCCGQPLYNSGHFEQAAKVGEHLQSVAESCVVVVIPSGSCTSMLKNHLPQISPKTASLSQRVFEIGDFLVTQGHLNLGAKLTGKGVLHEGCHGKRELHSTSARTLLSHVEGLELVEQSEPETCCGFGGTFTVKFPEISGAMGETKLVSLESHKPDFVLTTDSSCQMHLAGLSGKLGKEIPFRHYLEVLVQR